ncbi:MAG: hypothetical protein IT380_01875 [Myxococcales bacterium]|nr:hypothetical protein [Myxococcales bacterium]
MAWLSLAGPALAQMAIEPFSAPVDAGKAADAGAASGAMAIDSFEPVADPPDAGTSPAAPVVEAFSTKDTSPTARVYGWAWGHGAVDTTFDSERGAPMAENVAEGRLKALLGVDVKLNPHLRLVLEGRAQVRVVTQRDFDRAKGFYEAMLGDAFVDLYTSKVDLRVGNQRIPLGANPALAPADALNPRDLRESLISGEVEDTLLPVFAIRAQGDLGKVTWLAAYAPFFTPHRYFVFGQDEALLQPGLGPAFDNTRVDPSVEDYLQDRVLETQRPPPFAGDVALRVVRHGRVKLGASWVWMNEKLPRVVVDPELQQLMAAQARGEPADPALAASVLNRFQAGEDLYVGNYKRTHLFSLEGSALLGPGQLDVDVTFTPRQTYFDLDFTPLDKAALTWVLGYSQASDSPLLYTVGYLGMAVFDVKAQEQLFLIEPATAVGAARTAFFHLLLATVGYGFFDKKLEVTLRVGLDPIQWSLALGPRVSWEAFTGFKVFAGAEFFVGQLWTPFGYFGRNDKVLAGVRYDLW